ncbi:MAG: SLC26A/SulP transporter family protein [Verrucomicrobia bacterium]|nr:SLC26A/SulP transporter family protein [Verrucomicrobiota bacterium]
MPTPAAPSSPPSRSGWIGEIWGGFAAMLVALPSSIAYGVSVYALLGPAYVAQGVRTGIVGAIVLGLVASAMGGAPRLISAPCAPAGAVLAALAGGLLATAGEPVSPERVIALLALLALLSGALQLVYGLLGGGKLIKYIPYPVVSGYLSGVGVLIFISQVPKFLGTKAADIFVPGHWQTAALVVGAVTIFGMLLGPKLTKAVPATILGLAAGLVAYFALAAARPELRQVTQNPLVIGPLGGEGGVFAGLLGVLPALAGLHLPDLRMLVVPAITLSVLLSVDTLKTCVVVDTLTRSRHDSNRTLLGQGAGNLVSACFGGMPGAGMMGATLVCVDSGGRTRLSGMIEALFVLLAALVLGQLIAWVPVAALAGILIVVALRMVDWHSFALLRQRSTMLDFAVIATVVVVAVAANLIAAAGAGVALSMLLFIREQIHGSVVRRKVLGGAITSTQHRVAAEQAVLQEHGALTVVCELQGSLFFGTTDQLRNELERDLKSARYLILDLRRVTAMDYTAAHLFRQFEASLEERGGCLVFSRLPPRRDLQEYIAQVGVLGGDHAARRFETLDDALQWTEDRILDDKLPNRNQAERPLELAEFDLCRQFDADHMLAALASCAVARSCAAGEVIFTTGQVADELYLVRSGIVRVSLPLRGGTYHNIASFGRGNFFGEIAFLDRGQRSANAVATTPVELYVISRHRFDEMSHAHPVVGVKVFARLARTLALRLRATDAELRATYDA